LNIYSLRENNRV